MIRRLLGVSVGWVGISMIGDGLPALLLPHQLAAAGRTDATTLGVISLLAIGAAAVVQPFAGAAGDRVGRFPVIAAGCVLATLGLVLVIGPSSVGYGAVLALVGASIAQAGLQPLAVDRLPHDWHGRAAGLKGSADVGGAFLAFLVLAALLGAGAVGTAVAVLGTTLVACFAVSRLLVGAGPSNRSPALNDATITRPMMLIVAGRFLFLLGIYAVGRFLLLFVAATMAVDADAAAESAGAALALLTGVTVLASVPAGWLVDRIGPRQVLAAGGMLAGAGIGLLGVASSMAGIIGFGVLMALGSAAFGAASWSLLTRAADAPGSGRLLGLANLGTAGAAAAAGAFGPLIDALGFAPAFGAAAAFALAGGALTWRAVAGAPSQRRLMTSEVVP